MNIPGISACYHDSAAALMCDGAIVAAAQEGRFNPKKHDARFPAHAGTGLSPMLRPFNNWWLRIGHVSGWINTLIILGLIYLMVSLPAGWLLRVRRKDPNFRSFDAAAESYRVPAEPSPREQLEKPF